MALAESDHHASPQAKNMARVGEEGHEKKDNAPWRQKPQRPRVDTEDDAEHTVVIPQERISERTMEQTIDALVPQDMKRLEISSMWRPHQSLPAQRLTQCLSPSVTSATPAPVTEYSSTSPAAAYAVPTPSVELASPAPTGTEAAPAPVI